MISTIGTGKIDVQTRMDFRTTLGVTATGRDKTGKIPENAVGRIQQMLDPESKVTYREKIPNRLVILREFDVVIRGGFAGQPMLGVIECKDWAGKVGTRRWMLLSQKVMT